MLAYILAVLVGTGSVGLYIAAFFFPEIHRKQDFVWSGVGFFYALILWVYARQETGGILLGQATSVALLGWLALQNLKLRRQLVPVGQQTPIPSTTKIKEKLGVKPVATKPVVTKPATPTALKPTAPAPATTPASLQDSSSPPTRPAATRPSARPTPVSIEDHMPKPVQQVFQPVNFQQSVVAEEAWIKLEVKPAAAPTKPLGTAVQPPAPTATVSTATQPEPARSPATIPEVMPNNIPTDSAARPQVDIDVETENWD
jgi:Ycf66 protein N-terminus